MTSLRPENASDWHPRKRRHRPRSSSGKPKSWSRAKASPRPRRDRSSSGSAKAYCGRISSCQFDDPELAGCTVGDVLADPERFEGETLADPLEGEEYGPCKARIMRRSDGTPWIHSFAHGRTVYELKHDAASVRRAMEKATKGDVVAALSGLAAGADIDAVELEELRQLAKELSGAGLHAINAMLKAA